MRAPNHLSQEVFSMEKVSHSVSHIYEHPFGERVKLLLRLEIIFFQAIYHRKASNQYETQMCLDALFALLNLTNRYELRAELLKELERIRNILIQLQRIDGVSDGRIEQTLEELSLCTNVLHSLDSKHIDRIRNIEFLNKVKLRNIHETGSYLFEIPELQYWLLQSTEQRERQILLWLEDFMPFKTSIDFLLRLIRESTELMSTVAENGVYIKTLDSRSVSHQLLRIVVDEKHNVYPSISGNEYRFVIRFMQQKQADERACQSNEQIDFKLACCGI